jgi:uncharacterized protein YukE
MNKILITDTVKFEEVIDNIENTLPKVKDAFQSERTNSVEMSGTDTWKGQSQEKIYEKYQQLEQNFTPIEETIALYVRFLRKTLEDYVALDNDLKNKIDEYAGNQMDVNS